MPSTYSTSLRLQLMATGENNATWGDNNNNNLGTLIETAIAGVSSVALTTSTATLTASNGVADQSRAAVLSFTGSPGAACTVTIPSVPKTYIVKNGTTGGFSVLLKTAVGTTVTISNGTSAIVYCDATDTFLLVGAKEYSGTVGGTADVITITPSPVVASYVAGDAISWIASGANTTNVTINVSGLGAKALTKRGSTALIAGDVPSGALIVARYDGTQYQLVAQPTAGFLPLTGGTLSGALTGTSATLSGALTGTSATLSGALTGTSATLSGALTGTTASLSGALSAAGATLTGVLNQAVGAAIASASTINLTTATGNLVHITGTTAITTVTLGAGMVRTVIFDGVLTLTHNATTNNLPGAANITTAAGDRAIYVSDGTTVYCVGYDRAGAFSYVRLNRANGYGSTNTKIRRFLNSVNSGGTDITYADSATLGGSFTLNSAGLYTVSYSDIFTAGAYMGCSLNSTQLTTSIDSISVTDILTATATSGANFASCASATFRAAAGDVLRAHTDGSAAAVSGVNLCQFTIARIS